MKILSKAEYFRLAKTLVLGNQIAQWPGEDFYRDPPKNLTCVAVRGLTPDSRKYQAYDLTVPRALSLLQRHGARNFLVDEQAPDHLSTVKGEIMRDERIVYMRYDQTPGLRMRQAYPIMRHTWGLQALSLVRTQMDQPSWEQLHQLWDDYPDSIIEFSCYSIRVGILRLNTIFWEVRNY